MFEKVRTGMGWMIIRYNGNRQAVRSAVEQQWKQITPREFPQVPSSARTSSPDLYKRGEMRAAKMFERLLDHWR